MLEDWYLHTTSGKVVSAVVLSVIGANLLAGFVQGVVWLVGEVVAHV